MGRPLGKYVKGILNPIVIMLSDFLYAQSFNIKYNYVGHLFQGRYGAEIIETDRHRLEVSRYIHLNPMRAKMVIKPEEYKWSSYKMYIGIDQEKVINTEYILSYFNKESNGLLYKQFVESAIDAYETDKQIV